MGRFLRSSRRAPAQTSRLLRLYRLALYLYPATFRRAFGEELWQTARDAHEVALAESAWTVALLWMAIGADLLRSALPERINAMRRALLLVAVMTCISGITSVFASLNLYLLEDANPLTTAAFGSSPLLRVSYDAAYLSALVAGVGLCAIVAYAAFGAHAAVAWVLAVLALLVALAGFGGLLARAPLSFVSLFAAFAGLTLLSVFAGWRVAGRLRRSNSQRRSAVAGACAGAGVALLVNALAITLHTLALNPVSHPLYMQGQIPGTHLNALLIGMVLDLALLASYGACLLLSPIAGRSGSQQRSR
ncbi:MAG: hypothetical protein ABI068_03235 [Ktedonobacterales bacterium]